MARCGCVRWNAGTTKCSGGWRHVAVEGITVFEGEGREKGRVEGGHVVSKQANFHRNSPCGRPSTAEADDTGDCVTFQLPPNAPFWLQDDQIPDF